MTKIYHGETCQVETIQASQCARTGQKIVTLVLEYPRVIHSQLLTHRVFTKNSSSTRAVPAKRVIEQLRAKPAEYLWTSNQAGMQGNRIEDEGRLDTIEVLFESARDSQIRLVERLTDPNGLNVHKQNACRLLEPFQNIRVCLTSTEWDNWDWLRIDPEAQGEIVDLANMIKQARDEADYEPLSPGDWHVPFVTRKRDSRDVLRYYVGETEVEVDVAIKVSMSCAAQTSYRVLNETVEKAEDIMGKLFTGRKVHASPSEHQATPIPEVEHRPIGVVSTWPEGVTHMDRCHRLWSGNFREFIQNRQLIPNHDGAKLNQYPK